MDYASRMSLLGTESAFDVLVKARALEARGKDIIHLEIIFRYVNYPVNLPLFYYA